MNKTKKLIEETILFSMESVKEGIIGNYDEKEIKSLAESVKLLAEAYDIVHRGKKVEHTC